MAEDFQGNFTAICGELQIADRALECPSLLLEWLLRAGWVSTCGRVKLLSVGHICLSEGRTNTWLCCGYSCSSREAFCAAKGMHNACGLNTHNTDLGIFPAPKVSDFDLLCKQACSAPWWPCPAKVPPLQKDTNESQNDNLGTAAEQFATSNTYSFVSCEILSWARERRGRLCLSCPR